MGHACLYIHHVYNIYICKLMYVRNTRLDMVYRVGKNLYIKGQVLILSSLKKQLLLRELQFILVLDRDQELEN